MVIACCDDYTTSLSLSLSLSLSRPFIHSSNNENNFEGSLKETKIKEKYEGSKGGEGGAMNEKVKGHESISIGKNGVQTT
jgi:hypothetical protein